MGISFERGHGGFGVAELPDLVGDEEIELGGEGGEIGGGDAQQAAKGAVEAGEQAVEQIVVGARPGGERGFGAAEAGEGLVPFSDRGGLGGTFFVIPDSIRNPSVLRRG